MANKKGVIMYYDLIEQLSDFNDKDFREIIIAMMEYDKTGKEPQFDGMKKVAFKFIKTTIDKNNDEYAKKCEKNRENAMSKWGKIYDDNEDGENLTLKQKNSKLRRERLKQANFKGTHTEEEWEEMKKYFNNVCVKCGNQGEIVKDHIVPIYMGGSNGLGNIQPLCRSCNSSKGKDTTDYREVYCLTHGLENPYSVCERSNSLANATDIDKDIDKDIDIKKENIIINNNTKEKDSVNASHTQKHKHGEYKNVLLSDDELEKLNETYGEDTTQRAITYLDEYIEMKGYKAKSHYLCIRKWVINALKEHKGSMSLQDKLAMAFKELDEERGQL